MTFWLSPLFWTLAVAVLLCLPMAIESALEVKMVDPSKCTLEAKACDVLRHK